MTAIALVDTVIDPAALIEAVGGPGRGGIALFLGTVRNHHGGRAVVELEYSAYRSMAESVLGRVVSEAAARWPVTIVAQHRLGRLEIGDIAVAVVVSGDHRAETFDACRYVIEEVKRRVPIWKRERYVDGTEAWVDPTAPAGVHLTEPPATR